MGKADGLFKFNLFNFGLIKSVVTNKKKEKKIHDDMLSLKEYSKT